MPLGQFKIFLCRHWCKRPLVKNTKTYNITFQNYRLENKLPKKLGDEMFIIISNSVLFNQKSVLLLNSSGRIIGNRNLLPPLYRNPLLFTIYINIKPGLNSSLIQVVIGYHVKVKFQIQCLHHYYNIIIMSHLKLQRIQDFAYWCHFLLGILNISGIFFTWNSKV